MVYTYKTDTEWIGYLVVDNCTILSAHTNNNKYGIKMLKKLLETFNMFNEVVTVLPYEYLVCFFSKHYEVICIDLENKLYIIRKRG